MSAKREDDIIDEEVEVALAEDAIDRIEDYWFKKLNISHDDYVYVKKVDNHLVVGKAEIKFIE
ncbi:MAG: hypothetical protein DRN12_07830 [Thermoplasmata archaeon]|nr:MAG: hypothetical protein DRN12_07830 [Thermoplasmata archaeon]